LQLLHQHSPAMLLSHRKPFQINKVSNLTHGNFKKFLQTALYTKVFALHFLMKNMSAKAFHKLLLKLTTSVNFTKVLQSDYLY